MPAYTGTALSDFFTSLDATARGGLMTGIILIAGSLGQYIAGSLTRRFKSETLQLISTALVSPLLAGMALLSGAPMLISAMAFSFVFYGLQPLGNTLVAKYSPPGLRGRSYGLSFFLSFGVGAFGSGFAGSIGQRISFSAIYLALAAISCTSILIAVGVVWWARRRESRLNASSGD
jgi:MFS family permease